MKLSIIMPAYNSEKTIGMTLDSIVPILNSDIELIIIDDGSSDNTYKICDLYKRKHQTISIIRSNNMGVSNARNTGISISKGKYIMFIDSDDENLLRKENLSILDNDFEFVLFSYIIKWANRKERIMMHKNTCIKSYELPKYIIENRDFFSSPWGKIYRKDIIEKNQIKFIPNQKYGEDTAFVITYLSYVKRKIIISDIISYRYFLRSQSASGFRTYYKEINIYLYNVLKSYLMMKPNKYYIGEMANYLFDKAIMHYYLNNHFFEFKVMYIQTIDYFKKYIEIRSIDKCVLKYKFPTNDENVKYMYIVNMKYKIKNAIKKVIWK